MGITENGFSTAADKFADEEHRMGIWEFWAKYDIRPQKDGRRYVVAVDDDLPPAPELKQDIEKALEKTGGQVFRGSTADVLLRKATKRREARKKGWVYWPLVENPDLFLEFARLADGGGLDNADTVDGLDTDKNASALLGWAREHGVLGLTRVEPDHFGFRGASTLGGKADTVAAFAYEAWRAHDALRLYEAAIAEELDVDFIASYMPPRWRTLFTRTPARAQAWALEAVATETQGKVAGNAYPALYGEVGRFVQGWSFTNLLGAMWLQMFWLLTTAEAPARCRQCDNIIAYEQPEQPQGTKKRGRKKEKFCSKQCSDRYVYRTKTRPRRHAARES